MRLLALLAAFLCLARVSALWQANCTQNCTVNFLSPVVPDCAPINCSIVCENGDPEDYCRERCETIDSCEMFCNQDNCTSEVPDCRVDCSEDLECDDDGGCVLDCDDPDCVFVIAPGAPIAVPVCDEPVCSEIFCEESESATAPGRFSLF